MKIKSALLVGMLGVFVGAAVAQYLNDTKKAPVHADSDDGCSDELDDFDDLDDHAECGD